jgi:uncharacterized protein DUF2505
MRFQIEQEFSGPVDAVARVYTEPRFYELVGDLPKLGKPEVLDRRENGAVVHLSVRYRFTGDLSPAVTKFVDPAKLSWVEESVHDLKSLTVTFRMKPDNYADRLQSQGSSRYRADDGVTRRLTEGDLAVKLPLLMGGGRTGGVVERSIVSGLREHLAGEIAVVERLLNER